MQLMIWLAIAAAIAHAAMFSGLNLAVFSVSRLRRPGGIARRQAG